MREEMRATSTPSPQASIDRTSAGPSRSMNMHLCAGTSRNGARYPADQTGAPAEDSSAGACEQPGNRGQVSECPWWNQEDAGGNGRHSSDGSGWVGRVQCQAESWPKR